MQKLSPVFLGFKALNRTKNETEVNNTQTGSNNLERSPKDDVFKKDPDKKKIILAAGALITAITVLACFIKRRYNTSINHKNVTPPKKINPSPVKNKHKANAPSRKPDAAAPSTCAKKAGRKLNKRKNGTQLPSESSPAKGAPTKGAPATGAPANDGPMQPSVTNTVIEETKPVIAQETGRTPAVNTPKVPEVTIQPKAQIFGLVFDEKVFGDLQDYRKALFSSNPPPVSNELIEGCKREQRAIEKAYLELKALYERSKSDEIAAQISEMAARYKALNYIKTVQEINKLKSKLDELDPKAYERIVKQLRDEFGEEGAKCLRSSLIEEIGKKTFKTSPVYKKLLKAAQELGIEGKDDKERIKKLFEMAGEDCLGSGEEGAVFRVPKTNLAVKIPGRFAQLSDELDIDSFQYVADISEYQAVNNVLAKNSGGVEIQEYIDAIKGNLSMDDAQRVISDMPQSAYDNYLAQVVRINKAGRGLDTGGPNLLVDAVNCRFVPIDLHPNASFEAGFRTKIDELGRNYIDPLAHTVGNFPFCMDAALKKKRIGKILKSIARDTENYQMYLFDTSFYAKRFGQKSKSTIKEAFRSSDKAFEALGDEIDSAFNKMHQTKLQYSKSGSIEDKKKMDKAIEQFLSYIDEKLLNEPDLTPSELAKMQMKINVKHEYNKLKYEIKDLEERLEHLSGLENPTEHQRARTALIKGQLEEARGHFEEFRRKYNEALSNI